MEGEEKLCHLRKGGDLKKEMKQKYWARLYTWQRAEGQELSIGGHTDARMWEGEIIVAFDTKTVRGKIGSEPV